MYTFLFNVAQENFLSLKLISPMYIEVEYWVNPNSKEVESINVKMSLQCFEEIGRSGNLSEEIKTACKNNYESLTTTKGYDLIETQEVNECDDFVQLNNLYKTDL